MAALMSVGTSRAEYITSMTDPAADFDFTQYTHQFTATGTSTYLTFLFRHDPAYWTIDDLSFRSNAALNTELLSDEGFESGALSPSWMFVGQENLPAGGLVSPYVTLSGNYAWRDGAVGGVDGFAQRIATTIGQTYTLSYWLEGDAGNDAWFAVYAGAPVSTYNGFTILYDGNQAPGGEAGGITDVVPEPSTYALMALGLGVVLVFRKRKVAA